MQSIDSLKKYAHGMSKDLVHKKEEIKCKKDTIKQNKIQLTFMLFQKETEKNIIQIDCKFLITLTD